MRISQTNLLAYVALQILLALFILDQIFLNRGISSLQSDWAAMTVVTALSFSLLYTALHKFILPVRWGSLMLLLILTVLQVISPNPDSFWLDSIGHSSTATSLLFLIMSFGLLFRLRKKYEWVSLLCSTIVFLTGGFATIIYLIEPQGLYSIPFFETVSWNTSVFFMIAASIELTRWYKQLLSRMSPSNVVLFKSRGFGVLYNNMTTLPILILVMLTLSELVWTDTRIIFGVVLFMLLAISPLFTAWGIQSEISKWLKIESESLQQIEKQNQKLALRNRVLKAETEMRKQAAQITSHNLRGTAVAIKNVVEMLEDENVDEEMEAVLYRLLKDRVDQNIQTLEDLGEFYNKLNSDENVLELCVWRGELLGVFKECKQIYSVEDAQIEVKRVLPDVIYPQVYFSSLVYNLMTNAFKYRDCKKRLQVTIDAEVQDEWIVITFSDNGKGLDLSKNGDKVFKYGKTFHGNEDAKGMGLFMTKAQLGKFGHEISMESTPGLGTTFTVKFNRKNQELPKLKSIKEPLKRS